MTSVAMHFRPRDAYAGGIFSWVESVIAVADKAVSYLEEGSVGGWQSLSAGIRDAGYGN